MRRGRCLDDGRLGGGIDENFIADLRVTNGSIDSSGENGKFYAIAFDELTFKERLKIVRSEVTKKEMLWFLDIKKAKFEKK